MKKHEENQRRRPRQARAQATYDSILEAAVQVIARDGAQGLNTNAVAERAGVSIGTLYQYFPDKDAILLAATRRELAKTESVRAQRSLIEALVRALEQLLGGAAPARRRNAGAGAELRSRLGRKAVEFEELLFGWVLPPLPAQRLARAASRPRRR
jgi:AcrR family transcriptional regulator